MSLCEVRKKKDAPSVASVKLEARQKKARHAPKTRDREARNYEELEPMDTDVDPSLLKIMAPADENAAPTIRPFKLSSVGPDFTMSFIGKRREGKSFMMRYIAHAHREKFPRVFVFTNTKLNGYWQKMVPDKYIFEGFLPGTLQAIMDEQNKLVTWWHKHKADEDFNPYILIIFDDVISDDVCSVCFVFFISPFPTQLHHSPELKTLFFNGRYVGICVVYYSLMSAKIIATSRCKR